MLELVFLYLLICGAKKAWDDTKATWGKSRKAYMKRAKKKYPSMSKPQRVAHAARHDLGYGLSQLLHGFPTARHGFGQGWNEGREAHVRARTAREQARTGHVEAHAGALAEWRELRERRREAREEIRRQRQGSGEEVLSGGSASPEPCGHAPDRCLFPASCPCSCGDCLAAHASWVGREPGENPEDRPAAYCGYCGTPDSRACPPHCATWTRDNPYPGRTGGPAYSYGPESATAGWPAATAEQAHYQAQRMAGDGPWVVTEYPPGGGPGRTVATYRNGELVTGPEQEAEESKGDPGAGQPEPAADHTASPTEGTTSMSDVTYDGVTSAMGFAVENAEIRTAEVGSAMAAAEAHAQDISAAKTQASSVADEMQALNVDPATLGAMADHHDALDEAEKAHQQVQEGLEAARKASVRVQETAQHVVDALARGHAGLAEAHQNAPVEAANREFYAG